MRAHDAAHQSGIDGGGRALTAHVADRNTEPGQRIRNKIVEIAANSARRNKFRRNLQIAHLRQGRRKQAKLQFACQSQIPLQALLLPLDLFVQSRVFDGDCKLRRQRGEHSLVILREIVALGVLQIQNADYFFLINQRYRQLRFGLWIYRDVARILGNVRN